MYYVRHIESNTGKSTRQGNLRHPRVRFQSFADEARRGCRRFPCLALFAGVRFYFSFLCVLREGYYVIIWLIRICVFIKDWKLIFSELFILKRKSMEIHWGEVGRGGSWHKLYSMHLPITRTWFFCIALVQDKKISHR